MTRLRQAAATMRAFVGRVLSGLGVDEIVLFVALALIATGFWMVWKPGTFLVPGLVLLWLVLPARSPFVVRPPVPSTKPSPSSRRTP